MAATYRAAAIGTTYASNKSMLTVFNGSGSGQIIRIKRIWHLNNQTTGVTGVLTTMEVRRLSASSGGSAITAIKHDTSSSNIPAQILISSGATDTLTSDAAYMRYMYSNDEPAVGTLSNDEVQVIPLMACVFDVTGDADLEPIVLREGQGLCLRHVGSSAVGIADVIFEFTMSSS